MCKEMYDCIIAGGGPAGAVCGTILQKKGLRCLLLEGRARIDEKICGGFVPDRCRNLFLDAGIDLSELLSRGKRIAGYREIRLGKENTFLYREGQFGIGLYRRDLDSFLLQKASMAGAEVFCGEPVFSYKKKNGLYHVNGRQGRALVLATGAKPPLRIEAFDRAEVLKKAKGQSAGISEIVRIDACRLDPDLVYFWYEGELQDYFWAIPISQNTWNIGYWTQREKQHLKKNFLAGRKKWIDPDGCATETIRPPRGALLGNTDFSECLADRDVLCCGDLAGTDNILTGEGIAQAVRSAGETAEKIVRSLER